MDGRGGGPVRVLFRGKKIRHEAGIIYCQMTILKKYPFYIRATVILFGLVLVSYALANLRGILIPFSFALFLAILLNPLVDRLQKWKVAKVPSIIIAIVAAVIAISGLWYFLATQ